MKIALKSWLRMFSILLPLILASGWGWQIHRQMRQEHLNQALIDAIKDGYMKETIALLKEGANANARDIPLDGRPIWQRVWDDLRKRHNPEEQNAPTALLLLLERTPHSYQGIMRNQFKDVPQDHWAYQAVPDISIGQQKIPQRPPISDSSQDTMRVAEALLARNASVQGRDWEESTPLLIAIEAGFRDVALQMLNKGADPNALNMEGVSPLHAAADRGDMVVIQRLLDKGASVNVQEFDGSTPLFEAVIKNHEMAVRLLLNRGAAVDRVDTDKSTLLYYAARSGNLTTLSLLLNRGGGAHIRDLLDNSPISVYGGHELSQGVVRFLKQWETKHPAHHIGKVLAP